MKPWLFLEKLLPSHRRSQRGQTLVIFAFLAIFMLLLLGLVLDSVRLFILAAQAERIAEAASLAGALYMPDYFSASTAVSPSPDGQYAEVRACAIARQNGITNCPAAAGQVGAAVSQVPGNKYEIQVTVTLQANVFFLSYIAPNLSSATVSRAAIAQYLPPIQLGSRTSYFGDEVDAAAGQNFWAAINGPSELKESGDAFTPTLEEGPTDPINYPDASSSIYPYVRFPASGQLTNHQQWGIAIANPDQQPAGFTYADGSLTAPGYNYEIVVPATAGNVQLQIYNPAFDPSNNGFTADDLGSACYDPTFNSGTCATDKSREYMQMHYALYSAPLPFERSADTLLAKFGPHSLDYYGDHCSLTGATPAWDPLSAFCIATPTYVNGWYTLATLTPGTYRLAVAATTGSPGNANYYGYGRHYYGIRLMDALGLNPAPSGTRIWAWGDMCVHFNIPGNTTFDLGEIPAAYAGKTLDFSLFDPGEGTTGIEILDPSGNPVQLPSWVRTVSGSGGTELDPTNRFYNGLWLHMRIPIPATYNPTTGNDWWKIAYFTSSAATDTITISVSLSGSPIHLVNQVIG